MTADTRTIRGTTLVYWEALMPRTSLRDRTDLGRALEARSTELGMTNEQVAAAAGLTGRTVLDLISGSRTIFRASNLRKMDLVYKLPIGTLEGALDGTITVDEIQCMPVATPGFIALLRQQLALHGAGDVQASDLIATGQALMTLSDTGGFGDEPGGVGAVLVAIGRMLQDDISPERADALLEVEEVLARHPGLPARDRMAIRQSAAAQMTTMTPRPPLSRSAAAG